MKNWRELENFGQNVNYNEMLPEFRVTFQTELPNKNASAGDCFTSLKMVRYQGKNEIVEC